MLLFVQPTPASTQKTQVLIRQHRSSRNPLLMLLLAGILALVGAGVAFDPAQAQTPRSLRIPPVVLPDIESTDAELDAEQEVAPNAFSAATLRNVIVDTDPGVDDAAAIIWLFSQDAYPVDVLGLVTVAGNTTVENATYNALLLRDLLGLTAADFAVVEGAKKPLSRQLSKTGLSIHGPDGLWFLSASLPAPTDPTVHPKDARDFYCTNLVPGTLVIALGPLTNLARAIQKCPDMWSGVEIVSLGGAKYGGNQTPVAEFNYWQDPEAAQLVLNNALTVGYTVDMMLFDAFKQFTILPEDLFDATDNGSPIESSPIETLLPALETYFLILGEDPPSLPDPPAMMYALDRSWALTQQPALVKVLGNKQLSSASPSLARGQTIIGLSVAERVAMIATDAEFDQLSELFLNYTLSFGSGDQAVIAAAEAALNNFLFGLLTRDLDNADVVVDIDGRRMVRQFAEDVRTQNGTDAQGIDEGIAEAEGEADIVAPHKIFVPMVVD